jgi:hypothetical protein
MRELDKLLLRNADRTDAITKAFEAELRIRYLQAYGEIESQLSDLYAKMGDTPSIMDARRYGRLDKLSKAIAAEYKKLTGWELSRIRDHSAANYAEAYYGTAWAYDQHLGVEVSWPVISAEAIRQSVWSGATGENFSDRLRQWNTRELLTLNGKITSGLAQGFGFSKMARTVKAEVGDDYSRIVRIVRTEAHRNYSQGHLDLYDKLEDLGIDARKQWVATLDTRTRDSHGYMDGKFSDDKGNFKVGASIGPGPGLLEGPDQKAQVINCRCRVVEIVDGLAPEYRRIRGEGIQPYQTFTDWASRRGWSEKTGWDITAKAKLAESQARKY